MTTATPTTGPGGSLNKTGTDVAAAKAKARALLEAKTKRKERRKKNRQKNKNNNNNNNHTRYDGLITDSIMEGVTISPESSAGMTADFRTYKKSARNYAAAKGYEYWPGVIENFPEKELKTKRPDNSQYVSKSTTKTETEGAADIMKQEWIVTDCEKQEELEDNYNYKLRQKLAKEALYRKNWAAL